MYEVIESFRKAEEANKAKVRYHNAYYSLDRDDGIEIEVLQTVKSPAEILLQKEIKHELISIVFTLPEKQAMRIYAYYFLDMSLQEIADVESVDKSAICKSILIGIKNLKNIILVQLLVDFSTGI